MDHDIFSNGGDDRPNFEDKSGVISDDPENKGNIDSSDPDVAKWLEKDHETVVQAKVNSDRYITQLQRELEGLRQELNVRTSLEEYLEAQKERQANKPEAVPERPDVLNQREAGQDSRESEKTKMDKDISNVDLTSEVKKTLEQTLAEREKVAREQRNLEFVKEKAVEALGPEYPYLFSQKAKERNLDQDYLKEMARTQPNTFLELMLGQEYKRAESGTPPTGSVSAEAQAHVNESMGRFNSPHISDWDHLKKDTREYWSPKVQNEIFEAAKKAAAEGRTDFYSRRK